MLVIYLQIMNSCRDEEREQLKFAVQGSDK
jgi:hypothetical protein